MSMVSAISRSANRLGLDPILVGIVAFFVAHMAIRLFGTSNLSVDETSTAIHAQSFQFYYAARNPPLFEWLYLGLSRLIGANLFTMQLLKTVLLTGGAVFLFLAIKPAFRHRAALIGAIASFGATVFYGWEIFQLFSHTNALVFALGFTFWAFMRVVRSKELADYALLGLGLGLGILSKYLFGLFFVALLLAALRSSTYRTAVLSPRIGIAFLVGLLIIAPFVYGLSDNIATVFNSVGNKVSGSQGGPDLASLAYLLALSAEFWLPFVVVLWISLVRWPAAAETGAAADVVDNPGLPDESFYPFLRDVTLLVLAAILVAAFLLGTRVTGGHYLVAALTLLPVAIFARLDRQEPFPALALNNYVRGALTVAIGIAVVRFLFFLFAAPPFCVPRCVLFVDYSPVVERLATADGRQNVILSNSIHIASNLLNDVPNARVIFASDTVPTDIGIADAADRNCSFVWFKKYRESDEQSLESALSRALRRPVSPTDLAAIGPIDTVVAEWQTKLLWDWGTETLIGIAKIDSAAEICEIG